MTVIILSKTASNLIPCVEAVRTNEPTAKIVVVDDGLSESVEQYGRDKFIEFDRVCAPRWKSGVKPFVFARNANIGIAAAGDDDVLLLNDDALLKTPGGFQVLADACAADPSIGIIASTCNNVGNRAQWPQGKGLRFEPRMVCFVCVYIPRATINAVGLLDERFVGYGFDDDDYCLRIRQAGLKIAIHDGCYVDHGSLKSSYRGEPHAAGMLNQNAAIYRDKWGEDNWGRR